MVIHPHVTRPPPVKARSAFAILDCSWTKSQVTFLQFILPSRLSTFHSCPLNMIAYFQLHLLITVLRSVFDFVSGRFSGSEPALGLCCSDSGSWLLTYCISTPFESSSHLASPSDWCIQVD